MLIVACMLTILFFRKMKKVFKLMIPLFIMVGCGQTQREKVPAIDLSNLDTTVSPAVDFYRYATGGWCARNPLPPEFSRYGSFDVLRENTQKQLNDLFAGMADMKTKPGSVDQKIADLYKMGMDSVRLNEEGAAPIVPVVRSICAIDSKDALMKTVASHFLNGDDAFFGVGVEADLQDSDNQVLYVGQGGLGMGDRDYYIEESNAALKEGYRNYLVKIFELSGLDNAEKRASDALSVEDALAVVSWSSVDNRDLNKIYNPRTSAEINEAYPAIRFADMMDVCGIPAQEKIILQQPSFFEGLDKIINDTDIEVLKNYVLGQIISGATGSLSDDFYTASWEFFSHQMAGAAEQKPRWKRAMSRPNAILGEAVGQMYVQKYFPESSKRRMATLVENLRTALGEHIDSLDWMSDTTKVRAHEKLDAFTVKIGYPDKWKDYSSLDIDPSKSYYENLTNAGKWYVADNLSKLGKPTDKAEWGMSPQTVNAYYNPTTNEICFPAAILQPPFFNADADDAVNYGAIGVVIGHEMSHGFDDQGSLFDAKGNMVNWWTDADKAKFQAKGEVLAAQFDEVEILPGVHANGKLTLGENIGDHGGLSIAYTAMQNAYKGKSRESVDGFTPEQRFWLSYGTIWAQNITPEEKARLTKLDVHSLGENRVNVSIRNFQEFFDAFGIKEGDPMFRPESERVHIW